MTDLTPEYLTLCELLQKCRASPTYNKSLVHILACHRNRPVDLIELVIEWFDRDSKHYSTRYAVQANKDTVVGISRVTYNKKANKGFISMVHVIESYRGKKVCHNMLRFLCGKIYKRKHITRFYLDVLADNLSAIKCYQNIGFNPIGNKNSHISMELNIKNTWTPPSCDYL